MVEVEQKQLNQDFVLELLKSCLSSDKVLSIVSQHLKYQYLHTEAQKKVFKYVIDLYNTSSIVATIGTIGQAYSTDLEVITLLSKAKNIVVTKEQQQEVISSFENFIKDSRFRILYDRLGDLYNAGKQVEALQLLQTESEEISNFQLSESSYTTVFKDFEQRQLLRERNQDTILSEKLPFGIQELDDLTRGGFNKGTSVLITGGSGKGKSTFLRWIGMSGARIGKRVVHFQYEGSQQECLDAYDAGWTSIDLHDIELGSLPEQKLQKILKAQRDILATRGEIYVYAAEKFDALTIEESYDIVKDIVENIGGVDEILFDYLEVAGTKKQFGTSDSSERRRREYIANKVTNMGIEFRCGVVAATQSMDILKEKEDNPNFVITRNHSSEFKGIVKPFSYHLTINQTSDESELEQVRLYCDKFRKYRSGQVIRIYQSLKNSRFYDSKRTLESGFLKSKSS